MVPGTVLVRVAPGIHEVARKVENEDRRRRLRRLRFLGGDVAPVGHDEMILRVYAHAPGASDDPAFGQRLGPVGIDLECRRGALGAHHNQPHAGAEHRQSQSLFHMASVRLTSIRSGFCDAGCGDFMLIFSWSIVAA